MDTVHHHVQVQVIGIGVQTVDHLMTFKAKLFEQNSYRFIALPGRGLLTLAPAQNIVIDRVFAPWRFHRQSQHLKLLRFCVIRQKPIRACVNTLLVLAPLLRFADILRQLAHARCLAGRLLRVRYLLTDHVRWPPHKR